MKKTLLKFIFLGDSGVGKTSIFQQYVNKKFSQQYKSTIGADFLTKDVYVDNKNVTLQVWDTAGQERFQSLGVAFYRGSDACIIVYDVTNKKSIDSLHVWRDEFMINSSTQNPDDFPILFLGNKIDKLESFVPFNESEIKSKLLPSALLKTNCIHYLVSAKDNINIEQSINDLAQITLKHTHDVQLFADFPDSDDQHSIIIQPYKIEKKDNSKCC